VKTGKRLVGKGLLKFFGRFEMQIFSKPPVGEENLYKFSLDTLLFSRVCGTFGIRARGGDTLQVKRKERRKNYE